jgi:hypothetical protein
MPTCIRVLVLLLALLPVSLSGGCSASEPAPAATAAPARVDPGTPQRQQWLEMFARGYFPGRSGQVFFVPREGDFLVDEDSSSRFMHGSPWPYDTNIPLILYGPPFIRAGVFEAPALQQDIAPTVAALLQLPPPATMTGRALSEALSEDAPLPRIVAVVAIDGMRTDYLHRHADVLPTLTRLQSQGAWFPNAHVNTLPTSTSSGHATIGTGTDPRVHGIAANTVFNRRTGRPQPSYEALDPGELMALTLADAWNLATDGRAVIVAHAGALRAAAGLVGHGSCLVGARPVVLGSYATETGGWETNPKCYALPEALNTLLVRPLWEARGGRWMGHDIASPASVRSSAVFQTFEGDALAAALEAAPLGRDGIADLVLVNFKAPDYVGHVHGPESAEIRETLAELDRQLARAVRILEERAGSDGLVVAITADHGMPGEPPAGRRRIPLDEIVAALDDRFSAGGPSIVSYLGDPANAQVHLDDARLNALGITTADVARFLEERFFAAAFTEEDVRRTAGAMPLGR